MQEHVRQQLAEKSNALAAIQKSLADATAAANDAAKVSVIHMKVPCTGNARHCSDNCTTLLLYSCIHRGLNDKAAAHSRSTALHALYNPPHFCVHTEKATANTMSYRICAASAEV